MCNIGYLVLIFTLNAGIQMAFKLLLGFRRFSIIVAGVVDCSFNISAKGVILIPKSPTRLGVYKGLTLKTEFILSFVR